MAGLALSIDQGWDLWKTTISNYPWKDKLTVLQTYNAYPVMNQWFAKDKMTIDGGTDIRFQLMVKAPGTASFVNPYTPNNFTVEDLYAEANVPWRQMTQNYSISIDELQRNGPDPVRLVNLLKSRRTQCMMSIADTLEAQAWRAPASAADTLTPNGIKYHLVPITGAQVTAATHGFQGANPVYEDAATASSWQGIDRSAAANARTRSYNDVWDNSTGDITDTAGGSVDKILEAQMRLKFQAPTIAKDVQDGKFANLRQYCNRTTFLNIDRRARLNNDSLGADLGRYAGETVIRGIPVTWVPYLDTDTSYPFYLINHDYFKPFVQAGDYFRETTPQPSNELHRVIRTIVDLTFNFVVIDPQKAGGVISYVAAA